VFTDIRAIAFDLDDTLWPCMPTIRRAERATYEWLREHYPRITDALGEQGLFEYRKAFMNRHPDYRIDLSLMRREMLAELAREYGYDPEALSREGFDLFINLRHEVAFYDDVFPVLERLRPHFVMGSISNGNADALRTPLKAYFSHHVSAADVMARKPDPRIFHAFCTALAVEPAQCLLVGDDPEYDIEGARAAGMPHVWINREGADWPDTLARPDSEISSLRHLPELLDNG
jgi:putative hydrolase of the HAD superfamily